MILFIFTFGISGCSIIKNHLPHLGTLVAFGPPIRYMHVQWGINIHIGSEPNPKKEAMINSKNFELIYPSPLRFEPGTAGYRATSLPMN